MPVRTLYHGGRLDDTRLTRLWATPDFAYAAAFAELYEAELWALSVDLADADTLDLTSHGFDAVAVATALTNAGIPSLVSADEREHPHYALWRVPDGETRAAGYRAVRIWESIDWGSGRRQTQSMVIVDLSAIVSRDAVPLPEGVNFQMMSP
jgi:hypothetical protein